MDFGHWENAERGMDRRKLHDVPVWRDSDAYTPLERDVMEYAEAMTATRPRSATTSPGGCGRRWASRPSWS